MEKKRSMKKTRLVVSFLDYLVVASILALIYYVLYSIGFNIEEGRYIDMHEGIAPYVGFDLYEVILSLIFTVVISYLVVFIYYILIPNTNYGRTLFMKIFNITMVEDSDLSDVVFTKRLFRSKVLTLLNVIFLCITVFMLRAVISAEMHLYEIVDLYVLFFIFASIIFTISGVLSIVLGDKYRSLTDKLYGTKFVFTKKIRTTYNNSDEAGTKEV